MYIEKMNITAFGRLNDFELDLKPGINIIEGANESGKSTIAAFIKFMFYGFTPKERTAYIGWDSTGAAGTLTLNTGSHRYRIERAIQCSGGSKPTFREAVQLVDLANNMPCHKGESPGLLFFGVDADMFAATAFVSQLAGTTVSGAKVSDGIENLLFSADETINTQRAIDKLDAARVLLLHKNGKGGQLAELSNEIAELESRLDTALKASADIRAKEARLADLRDKEASDRAKADSLNEKLELFETLTIAEGFDRMHSLEAKASDLKQKLADSGAPDPEVIRSLRNSAARIDQIKTQLDTLPTAPEIDIDPTLDDLIEKYREHGGSDGVQTEKNNLRSEVGSKKAAGIVLLVLSVPILGLSALSALLSIFDTFKQLSLIGLIVGAAILSFGAVLLNSAARSKKQLDELEREFDLDSLEAEIARRNSASDLARTNEVIRSSVQNQLDEALSALKRNYGIEISALDEKLLELENSSRAAGELKAEYDKTSALLMQMRSQLERYDESDIRARLTAAKGRETSGIDASNLTSVRREVEFLENSVKSLEKFSLAIERELAQMPQSEDSSKLSDRLAAERMKRSILEKKLAGLQLAEEKLCEASEKLRSSVAPRLAADAGRLLGEITADRYCEVGVGGELALTCKTKSGQRSIEQLSAGTQDAAYLALRIALCRLVYRKDVPPMIFDESFGRMDDERTAAMLRLAAGHGQSLILTANGREKALAGAHSYIQI